MAKFVSKIVVSLFVISTCLDLEVFSLKAEFCGELDPGVLLSCAAHVSGTQSILILGGFNSSYDGGHAELDQVVDYNVATHEWAVVSHFPTPIHAGASAVASNGDIYYFGGGGWTFPTTYLTTIYRLRLDDPTPVGVAHLPHGISGLSAISTGEIIYLFGGITGEVETPNGWNEIYSNQILRFDTRDFTIEEVAQLPQNITRTSAVWDGENAYIFGGIIAYPSTATNEVIRFNPSTNSVEVMESRMKTRLYGTNAHLLGDVAYIIGGGLYEPSVKRNGPTERLTKYNINTGETFEEAVNGIEEFPSQSSSIYTNGHMYIFEGTSYQDGKILCIEM